MPLDSFLQQGRALLTLSTGQMPTLPGFCACPRFPLWPRCQPSAAQLGHSSCFLEEAQELLIPFTVSSLPTQPGLGPGEKTRRRQADGKWRWEDADMAGATFLQRASCWQAALPRTLPCRQDMALLRNSLEPLPCFSGMVPAQSCSNTLVIEAQHEWWGWTGNFAACQEGLCQKIHRQQHTCTTFSFTDTFPKQIYLLRMKFSSLWSGVRLGWLGLFMESHQLSSGEFSSIKPSLCIPHCKIKSPLPTNTQDSNLWWSSGEAKAGYLPPFPPSLGDLYYKELCTSVLCPWWTGLVIGH